MNMTKPITPITTKPSPVIFTVCLYSFLSGFEETSRIRLIRSISDFSPIGLYYNKRFKNSFKGLLFDEIYSKELFNVSFLLLGVDFLRAEKCRRVNARYYKHRPYGVAKLFQYLCTPYYLCVWVKACCYRLYYLLAVSYRNINTSRNIYQRPCRAIYVYVQKRIVECTFHCFYCPVFAITVTHTYHSQTTVC